MIVLNGKPCELPAGEPLMSAIRRLGVDPSARGVAVALDGEVVPRESWERVALDEGARVEVLTAMQGG